MTATHDPDRRIRDHLALGPTELPDRSYAVVRAAIEQTLQRVATGPVLVARPFGVFRFSFAAAALVIVAVVGVNLVTRGGAGGPAVSTVPSASLTPTTRPFAHAGLPPEGTAPSDPSAGEVAIYRSGSIGENGEMWLYEDGRLITSRFHYRPGDPPNGFIGLFLQRLTPEGVDYLRSAILGTGMFQSDFVLAGEGSAPFLEIRVRDGDRRITGEWAWRGITGNAPTASPEEEAALLALNTLLTAPRSWPEAAWVDRAPNAYVPSTYGICISMVRLRPGFERVTSFDLAGVLALLPQSTQAILLSGGSTQDQSDVGEGPRCLPVTTDTARAFAGALDGDGVARPQPNQDRYWLGYALQDPRRPEHEIWIRFHPVLPHGEAIWLGPG